MTKTLLQAAPIAAQRAHTHELHGDKREDPYYWLRERDNPDVIEYLQAENAWCDHNMAPAKALEQDVFEDMKRRIKEDDESLPWFKGGYSYFWRSIEGEEYQEFWRCKGKVDDTSLVTDSNGECLLDCNDLAKGHAYFDLGALALSPDQRTMAYGIDTSGDEYYDIVFKDLDSGDELEHRIEQAYASFTFAADNRTFFYVTLDATHRPYRVWRLKAGEDSASATMVFEDLDEAFFLGVSRTLSDAWVMLDIHSKVTSEVHVLDANAPDSSFTCIQARRPGVEYEVDHHSDRFYMLTNEDAVNFKLLSSTNTDINNLVWQTAIAERDDTTLVDIDVFKNYLVVYERREALVHISVLNLQTNEQHNIQFDDAVYEVDGATNINFDTDLYQFGYSSLTTPHSTYDYHLTTRERTLRKRQPVLGGFDSDNYRSERLWIDARDGVKVPVSLVYHRDHDPKLKARPVLLTGYGSYGSSYPAYFSSGRLTLLDRGVVYAIAHIRGGQEMGRRWYDNGKFKAKKNTFNDFIDCAQALIERQYTEPQQLAIMGGSAGGLLIGAVVNDRPDLFCAALAQVPFVDVLTTMLDLSLPLTTIELEEWGDPRQKDFYDYMKSYSPYDNIKAQRYPAMLVTAGLNDPRVSYWEPAKWTARLRQNIDDDSRLLLKTNMDAGHAGASGRYGYLKEAAFEYAFVLDRLALGGTRLTSGSHE